VQGALWRDRRSATDGAALVGQRAS
jgi:hypothetical protein